MNNRIKIALTAGAIIAAAAGTAGMASASSSGGDDTEAPIAAGTELDRASAAALAETGEGKVTDTEVGDEESYYEVEVTLDDGTQVDVQLDRQFKAVGSEVESGTEADEA